MSSIRIIDLHYRGDAASIAAFLVQGPAGPVLIETGPGSTVGALEHGLAGCGMTPRDIPAVLVTHIHFDHAGASGWMAAHGATVHVHAFGAPHLVDPARLVASATRIYGDRMQELWGELIPIDPARVVPLADGDRIRAGGLEFRAVESPGHARHHHVFAVEIDGAKVGFTGDAAACFIADAPAFISLPTPPPEFDRDAWLRTIDRLRAERFDVLCPTHFGRVEDVAGHLDRVAAAIESHAAFVGDRLAAGMDHARILLEYRAWFLAQAAAARVPEERLGFYVKDSLAAMNVTGLIRAFTKQMT
ncbi:MAG: MBL fold metallo-hydrolase [Phycisphaeraceae bacterium]|nr:MBL fold metallo-hydrolase [Phycisphaeraceae bacterium]